MLMKQEVEKEKENISLTKLKAGYSSLMILEARKQMFQLNCE